MIKSIGFLISFLFCLFSAVIIDAGDSSHSVFENRVHDGHLCLRNSEWDAVKNINIKITFKQLQKSASYNLKIYDNNDMKLTIKDSGFSGNRPSGEAILVAGKALVTKNVEIEENYAIDVLDNAET